MSFDWDLYILHVILSLLIGIFIFLHLFILLISHEFLYSEFFWDAFNMTNVTSDIGQIKQNW